MQRQRDRAPEAEASTRLSPEQYLTDALAVADDENVRFHLRQALQYALANDEE